MRLFLAASFDDHVADALNAVSEQLSGTIKRVKWVKKGQLHMTLRFLGDTRDPEAVAAMLSPLVFDDIACGVSLRPGCFCGRNGVRVIKSDIRDGGKFSDLAFNMDTLLYSGGIPREERPFHPHITLGRPVSYLGRAAFEEAASDIPMTTINTIISSVHLFSSDLRPSGPVYERVRTFRSAGGD